MSLNETVLGKVANWKPAGDGRHSLSIADESGWTVAVAADQQDKLGCLIWELELRHQGKTAAAVTLQSWAKQVSERVNGLLEPLLVHEVDTQRNEAILRSAQPSQLNGSVYYHEVLLKGTERAFVRRYQGSWTPGQHRQQVPFPITHEALAKLAGDLAWKA